MLQRANFTEGMDDQVFARSCKLSYPSCGISKDYFSFIQHFSIILPLNFNRDLIHALYAFNIICSSFVI